MDGKVTYHQQVSYCGKPRCRRCREGIGHGPYWYAYKVVNGRTIRTYIGKVLPPDIQASLDGVHESPIPPTTTSDLKIATIRIYTLGQFRLERRDGPDWQTVTDAAWQHQRVRSLLGCLLSSPRRKLGREQLMDAIWPELDVETAAGRLDRAVYSLRQLFEPERSRLAMSPLLLTEREVLVLADQSQVWIDADAFERLLNQARNTDDPGEKKRLLEEASTLYGGDFLPEERKIEFTIVRREFLQRNWIGLLLELADLRAVHNLNTAIDPLSSWHNWIGEGKRYASTSVWPLFCNRNIISRPYRILAPCMMLCGWVCKNGSAIRLCLPTGMPRRARMIIKMLLLLC